MRLRSSHFAIGVSLLFLLAGQAFIPLLGVQSDEALFGMAFFRPRFAASIRLGHSTLPLMLMTYVGTFKAWLYRPILKVLHPQVWTIREPMVVAGALSIWLFYLLLKRVSGERAALIGCILLATDSLYLLTTCFDWGPVALQHLLVIAGMLSLVRFYQERSTVWLAAGAFLLGLGLWDKALATWTLSGLAIAALVCLWREIRGVISARAAGVAAAAFLLGSLPLWTYNVSFGWPTFRGNFQHDFGDLAGKARLLRATFEGQALFGYLTDEDWHTPLPHRPSGPLQNASARFAAAAGDLRHSLGFYVFLLALLLIPLAAPNDRRAILFALIAMAVAWIQMAITANAGGAVHHTILLWPLPTWVAAISLAAASQRAPRFGGPLVYSVVALVAVSNLLVTNTYYNKMSRNGGSQSWTDAIYPLTSYVKGAAFSTVYCMDWGIMDSLRLLSGGSLPLTGSDYRFLKPELTAEERETIRRIVSDGRSLYIAHAKDAQVFPDNPAFLKLAAEAGYRPRDVTAIADSFGRPTFEVYRLTPASEQR